MKAAIYGSLHDLLEIEQKFMEIAVVYEVKEKTDVYKVEIEMFPMEDEAGTAYDYEFSVPEINLKLGDHFKEALHDAISNKKVKVLAFPEN